MDSADYLIWVGAFVLLTAFFIWDLSVRRRARANLHALAQRLGFTVTAGKGRGGLGASGVVNGRAVRFSQFFGKVEGHAGAVCLLELEMSAVVRGFTFRISEKTVGRTLLGKLSPSDLVLGDPEFDQRWHIETNQPDLLRQMLTSDLRHFMDIATAASHWGEFRLEDGWVRYHEQHDGDGPDLLVRVDGLLKMMDTLANAAESARGKSTPV